MRGRLDGLLQGNHLGLVPGPGSEPGEARAYQPGDDVRRMDWAATARTTQPHVRQTIADRELETWVVLDLSPSLDFGTASCEKRDLAIAALAAVTHLTRGGGNRIGAIVATGEHTDRIPARGGLAHARGLLRRVAARPRARRRAPAATWPSAVEQLRRPPRRRGLCVVISDFLGEPDLGAAAAGAVGPARAARGRGARSARAGAARGGHRRAGRPGDRPAARGGDQPAAVPGVRRGRRRAPRPGGRHAAPLRGRRS